MFGNIIKIFFCLVITVTSAVQIDSDCEYNKPNLSFQKIFEFKGDRVFLIVNPDPKQNFFFDVDYTSIQGMGDYGHSDYKLKWRQQLNHANSDEMRINFMLDYGKKRESVWRKINPCKQYPRISTENIGKTFFFRTIAGEFVQTSCPTGKKPTIIPGHLEMGEKATDDITCNIPVIVVIYIWSPLFATGSDFVQRDKQFLLSMMYKGEFINCED